MKSKHQWREGGVSEPPSYAERHAWRLLRKRGILGYRFVHRYLFRDLFYVQFYCAELRLALEFHSASDSDYNLCMEEDIRSGILERMGIALITIGGMEITAELLEGIVINHNREASGEEVEEPPLDEGQRLG